MAAPPPPNDFLGAAAYQFEKNRPFMLMELHLLVSALFPIYTGAHASLSRPSSAAKPDKRSTTGDDDDDEEEEKSQNMEGLSPQDAVIFPITAGIVLAGLYFAIKAYGADMINLVLGVYFSIIGTYSVAKLISDSWSFLQSFITPGYYRENGKLWKLLGSQKKAVALVGDKEVASRSSPLPGLFGRIPLPASLISFLWGTRDLTKRKFTVKGFMRDSFDFEAILTQHNVLSTLIGISAISYFMFVDKPWWLTNLQGFAVSYGALQLMSPTTFATGTLILSGLFFYDIWAVFFTPLMVTVAKNLDVPIKLVFPRPDEPSAKPGEPPTKSYSMLGLGDIVLPGLMIALALRFDLYMFYLRKQKTISSSDKNVEKAPYVTVSGNWGDKLWTAGTSALTSTLPAHLSSSFPKPYFHATMVGYVFGMLLTLGFMTVFQHAQPALLYLVPCVLVSLWGTGLARGELNQMWNFTEALTGEAIDDDEKSESKSEAKDEGSPESTWSAFLSALFGHSKDKAAQQGADSKSEKVDTDSPEAKAKSTEKKQKSSRDTASKDKIFAFEVSRHHPKSKEHTEKEKGSESAEADRKQQEPSDLVSDDTVVVSSSDL